SVVAVGHGGCGTEALQVASVLATDHGGSQRLAGLWMHLIDERHEVGLAAEVGYALRRAVAFHAEVRAAHHRVARLRLRWLLQPADEAGVEAAHGAERLGHGAVVALHHHVLAVPGLGPGQALAVLAAQRRIRLPRGSDGHDLVLGVALAHRVPMRALLGHGR